MSTPNLVIRDASQLVTLEPRPGARSAEDALGIIERGTVVVEGERIVWVGPTASYPAELAEGPATRVLDASGQVVLPGFIDCHTHLIWAGERLDDFDLRVRGVPYAEIAARGGGILSTVAATRAASLEYLCSSALDRLDRMLSFGVTTVEAKSGYGLDLESELKILRAMAALDDLHPIDLVPTFLGAHTIPREYQSDRARYVDLLVEEMLPAVAEENLASFCDVYLEEGVAFEPGEARRILEAARAYGLYPKLHVDQLQAGAGAELSAELGAVSADHLEFVSEAGIEALARAGVVAVLLPGASLFLGARHFAPARRLLDAGVAVAIATDCNPGTSPTESLPLCGSLGSYCLGMRPAEVVRAITIVAARAVGREGEIGSLRPGKLADLVVLEAADYRELVYRFGTSLAAYVFKRGEEVYGEEPEGP
jgi:imidazolonepropionase